MQFRNVGAIHTADDARASNFGAWWSFAKATVTHIAIGAFAVVGKGTHFRHASPSHVHVATTIRARGTCASNVCMPVL